jgi:hypothetical protein
LQLWVLIHFLELGFVFFRCLATQSGSWDDHWEQFFEVKLSIPHLHMLHTYETFLQMIAYLDNDFGHVKSISVKLYLSFMFVAPSWANCWTFNLSYSQGHFELVSSKGSYEW